MKTNRNSGSFRTRLVSQAWGVLAILAALAVPTGSLAQAPTFNTLITTYKGDPSYAHAGGAAVGDFNGDGKLDSAVFDGTGTIHVLLGNGDGTFAEHRADVPTITSGNAVGLNPAFDPYLPHPIDGVIRAIKAVDVNGDGKLDLVCLFVVHINFAALGGATVLINAGNDVNGVPQFTTATHYFFPFEFDVRSLTVGDLNRDGKPDFIIGGAHGGLQVYLNNGDGTFTAGQAASIVPSAGGPAVGPGVIADLNGDGKPDYVVTSNQAGATDIFWGNGDGTFQPLPTVIPGFAFYVAVADMDRDGKPDLILSTTPTTVLLNNGDGTFRTGATLEYGGASVTIADMNGDGIPDIVEGYDIVWLGKGDGTFGSGSLFKAIDPNLGNFFIWGDVAVGDFNGDGKPDIFTVGPDNNYVGVLLNTTVFPAPAQLLFTDSLAGPSSPNLNIPFNEYTYVPSVGLKRTFNNTAFSGTDSSANNDRPMVATKAGGYLGLSQFTATLTIDLTSPDIAYFGFGQYSPDPNYFGEPVPSILFRVHNNWTGYSGIQVWATTFGSSVNSPDHFFNFAYGDGNIATYGGSPVTLQIKRDGDTLTFSIPSIAGSGSHTFSISQLAGLLGLNSANTYLYFGNSNPGTVFSNFSVVQEAPPVITSASISQGYGTAFSYQIAATGSPTNYTATGLPAGLSVDATSGLISGTLPNSIGTYTINLSASNAGGTGTGTLTLTLIDNVPPVLSLPDAIIAEATGPAGAVVTFNVSANDAIDGAVPATASPASGSTFPLGTVTVSVSAKDAAGNIAHGVFPVTVRDTTPPVLTVPANQVLEATSAAGAVATFAATATDLVTLNPAFAYSVNGAPVSSGSTFPLGTTTVTVTATDAAGNASTGTFTITVRDTTPPVIVSITASPSMLWPPNHKMVPVTLNVVATDAVGVASVNIISVTSNQTDRRQQWQITGPLTVNLLAARNGDDQDRIYTITVQARDAAGNASLKTATVVVPHDQRENDGNNR